MGPVKVEPVQSDQALDACRADAKVQRSDRAEDQVQHARRTHRADERFWRRLFVLHELHKAWDTGVGHKGKHKVHKGLAEMGNGNPIDGRLPGRDISRGRCRCRCRRHSVCYQRKMRGGVLGMVVHSCSSLVWMLDGLNDETRDHDEEA